MAGGRTFHIGQKLKFTDATDMQVSWGGCDDPRPIMKTGEQVTIKNIEVHTHHTKLEFKEFPGKKFNSISFSSS